MSPLSSNRPLWILVLLASLVLGCESSDGGSGAADGPRDAYPTANQGTEVGTSIADLTFLTAEEEEFKLSDIFFETQNKVLMVVTSAEWCAACYEHQADMEALYARHRDQGFTMLEAVLQQNDGTPATAVTARKWIRDTEVTFPVVADPTPVLEPYFEGGDIMAMPLVLLIEVQTMEILYKAGAYQESELSAIIESKL